MDKEREKDIQALCEAVLATNIDLNHNSGHNWCPFCWSETYSEEMENVEHKQDCAYLIAKDLSTKQ
tara:strand:- start:384 stop:581 length:198 start_codon:yes stop_codon:yes gene_type:complete